jgi:hypothetical protein
MRRRLSHICDEFSLLARMFRLATWAVTQASCLSRRTGILACPATSRLGSLHDVSGWKPKLR